MLLNCLRPIMRRRRSNSRRSHTGKMSALVSVNKETQGFGLLRGVDPEKDDFFASEIAMTHKDLAWLGKPGLVWKVVTKEAADRNTSPEKYLENLLLNFDICFRSKIVYGREGELKYLRNIMKWRGEMAFVVGVENTGKTHLLKNLQDAYNDGYSQGTEQQRMALYVDARLYNNDLSKGLYTELKFLQKKFPFYETSPDGTNDRVLLQYDKASYERELNVFEATDLGTFSAASMRRLSIASTFSATPQSSATDVVRNFVNFAKLHGRFPVLIIDHADDVLQSEIPQDRSFFRIIPLRASTNRTMNLILSTSTHGFHDRLERHLRCYSSLKRSVVMGDISPKQTWDLLVNAEYNAGTVDNPILLKTIGMGRSLAKLCLSAYGGHLFSIRNAILALAIETKNFTVLKTIKNLTCNTFACLETEESRLMLTAMARYGAFKQQTLEERIEKIVEENVGCLAGPCCCTDHVPETAYNGPGPYGILLAAPIQVQRLAIAWTLDNTQSLNTDSKHLCWTRFWNRD